MTHPTHRLRLLAATALLAAAVLAPPSFGAPFRQAGAATGGANQVGGQVAPMVQPGQIGQLGQVGQLGLMGQLGPMGQLGQLGQGAGMMPGLAAMNGDLGLMMAINDLMGLMMMAQMQGQDIPGLDRALRDLFNALMGNGHHHHHHHHHHHNAGAFGGGMGDVAGALNGGQADQGGQGAVQGEHERHRHSGGTVGNQAVGSNTQTTAGSKNKTGGAVAGHVGGQCQCAGNGQGNRKSSSGGVVGRGMGAIGNAVTGSGKSVGGQAVTVNVRLGNGNFGNVNVAVAVGQNAQAIAGGRNNQAMVAAAPVGNAGAAAKLNAAPGVVHGPAPKGNGNVAAGPALKGNGNAAAVAKNHPIVNAGAVAKGNAGAGQPAAKHNPVVAAGPQAKPNAGAGQATPKTTPVAAAAAKPHPQANHSTNLLSKAGQQLKGAGNLAFLPRAGANHVQAAPAAAPVMRANPVQLGRRR
jgi:hypothetical protein